MIFKNEISKNLLGITSVWTEVNEDGKTATVDPFQITADAGGIRFNGLSSRINTEEDLEQLARTVADAFKKFDHYRPKILNLQGH